MRLQLLMFTGRAGGARAQSFKQRRSREVLVQISQTAMNQGKWLLTKVVCEY